MVLGWGDAVEARARRVVSGGLRGQGGGCGGLGRKGTSAAVRPVPLGRRAAHRNAHAACAELGVHTGGPLLPLREYACREGAGWCW